MIVIVPKREAKSERFTLEAALGHTTFHAQLHSNI